MSHGLGGWRAKRRKDETEDRYLCKVAASATVEAGRGQEETEGERKRSSEWKVNECHVGKRRKDVAEVEDRIKERRDQNAG